MTATTKTANDKAGIPLYVGDEVICRATVTGVQDGHVLTNTVEPPNRELWFQGSIVERSAQGAASKEADRRLAAGAAATPAAAAVPAPGPVAVPAGTLTEAPPAPLSPREQAIAFVMSNGGYAREAAERIVEEHGTRYILADRDEEAELRKKAGPGVGLAASTASSPATSADRSAQPVNAAAQNEAATPGASVASAEGQSPA